MLRAASILFALMIWAAALDGAPIFRAEPAGSVRYTIEVSRADFGAVSAGLPREIVDAAVIRIVSPQPWVLKLIPRGPSSLSNGLDGYLPMSRLAWRQGGGSYQPLVRVQPVTVASGPATGGAAAEVRLDLRLTVEDHDPLGSLALELAIAVEGR